VTVPRPAGAYRPVLRALRRRRRLEASLVQLVYLVISFVVAVIVVRIRGGPTLPASTAVPLLFAIAGGLVAFIGVVYSLLYLVVQWASSNYSPRLNLFRDHPLVWHSFGFFVGTIVYCLTSGLALGDEIQVSIAVPSLAILASLALYQTLQRHGFDSIQLAPTLEAIAAKGRSVLRALQGGLPGGEHAESRACAHAGGRSLGATPARPTADQPTQARSHGRPGRRDRRAPDGDRHATRRA
jgi:uncharacterized membrane protein